MSKNEHNACRLTQQIEKDYISNMLGITEFSSDSPEEQTMAAVVEQLIPPRIVEHEVVDYNAPYKKTDFECQIFNIAGLNIAVATENISEIVKQQIMRNDSETSTMSLFAGIINIGDNIINVVDLEYLVMNGVDRCAETKTHEHKPTDIVLLKGSATGFIGNQMIDCQMISQQNVHWRDEKSERIWLAGTVAQMGLALLDVDGVIKLLQGCIK